VAEIDAKVGGFGIVPPELDGAIVSSHYFLYEIDDSRLNNRYFEWFIGTSKFREQVEAQGSTNYAAIRPRDVLKYCIPLPSNDEQCRIVSRIENLSNRVSDARELQKQVFKAVGLLSSAISDRAYESLRKEYGTGKLGSLCISISDGDHNTPEFNEAGVKFVFVGNVSSGYLHFEGSKFVTPDYFAAIRSQRVPRRGDILYSAVGATLGVPAIVNTDEQFCFQRHVAIIKPDASSLDSGYCWHMLRSRIVYDSAWGKTTGTAQPTIPLNAIRSLEIPVPPLKEQRRVSLVLDDLNASSRKLKAMQAKSAAELNALMPSILDKAFKGEL
jgi:type I restriction enzyme S subunit